jgi:hypothetical protein
VARGSAHVTTHTISPYETVQYLSSLYSGLCSTPCQDAMRRAASTATDGARTHVNQISLLHIGAILFSAAALSAAAFSFCPFSAAAFWAAGFAAAEF